MKYVIYLSIEFTFDNANSSDIYYHITHDNIDAITKQKPVTIIITCSTRWTNKTLRKFGKTIWNNFLNYVNFDNIFN